ncbi:F-box/kelch-repeat protein At3g06240-like [Papaver somniferum]|uniref:F-box/kelch-repeat protein At3g06240-like n=1 Tax=Papaver somniferum TaxID=3469 RepID=UPI000E7020F1|nr:F-box/kelch-repeat protein At3g06240-like [Papaver somniferum]
MRSMNQHLLRELEVHSTVPFNCFVGSLNGLICLVGNPTEEQPHEPIYIFNPVIKEYVMLPEINTNYSYDVFWTSGFGYVSATNEYKVVKIYISKTKVVKVCIYTLGSGNGWRNLGDFNPSFAPSPWAQGVFANGALHWMGVELDMIVTFNLAEEKFCQHLSPPPSSPDDWPFNRIGVLDGFWFFDNFLTIEEDPYYDIWLSKRKNDDHDMKVGEKHLSPGWSKEFRVDDNELLAVTKSGVVLTYTDNSLNIYNTKASTSKRLVEFKERIRTVFPHKNTLVSLKELGEEGTKIMEFIEIEETESLDQPLKQQ